MEAERWRSIERALQDVLDAPADQRAGVLLRSCSDDQPLCQEVESLLRHHAAAGRFLETPAFLTVPPRPGSTIGHYRILEEIGVGGMGVVCRAEDTKLGRIVALKFLAGRFSSTPEALERLRDEARAASALNHPNVCVIYDIDEVDGEQFIAMEFIEGRTLADLVSGMPLEVERVAAIGRRMAEALAAAHDRGIVHLDLKPANVMVAPSGLVKVLDFGVARLLRRDLRGVAATAAADTTAMAGTLPYMSPEQLRGQAVDHRADVFALGAVLYEMATGQRPFQGDTVADLVDRILHCAPIAPRQLNRRVPPRLAGLLLRCLQKDPDRRHLGAAVVAAELRQLSTRSHRLGRAGPWLMAALVTLGAVSAMSWSIDRRRDPPTQASWEQLTDFPDSATSPALSSDGRMLTFIRGSSTFVGPGDIYLKTLPDGDVRQVTDNRQQKQDPMFTPDGSRISYTTGPLPYNVWSVPVSGGPPQPMMRNASTMTWIGDGRVMFGEVRGAPHMALVTADERRRDVRDVYVPARVSGMAHRGYRSPDGQWVLVAEMDTGGQGWLPCRLVPLDGSSVGHQVGPANAPCTSAAWSPDGDWMYLSAAVDGGNHIWRQRFPHGDPEQVTFGPTQEEGIAMAADGRSLITSVGTAQSTLWLRDANGERRIRQRSDGRHTAIQSGWSHAVLHRVEAIARPGPRRGRRLVGRRGGLGETAARAAWYPRLPGTTFSPDGARVAVIAPAADGRSQLWLAPVDRHAPPTRVEWAAPIIAALFDRAGGLFVHVREDAGNVVDHVDSSGANRRRVTADPVAALLAVSPSGRWVLVRARLPGRPASSPGVVAYPVEGGRPVAVFDTMWPVAWWEPDGNALPGAVQRGEETPRGRWLRCLFRRRLSSSALPAAGLKSPVEAARLPGAKVRRLPSPGAKRCGELRSDDRIFDRGVGAVGRATQPVSRAPSLKRSGGAEAPPYAEG